MHIIFLPGASGRTDFWLPLIHSLPKTISYQIIAYPGFANEPARPDINNFEQLQDYVLSQINQPCILVAQSMGGIFAVAAALQNKQWVRGLVLIATSGGINLEQFQLADWRTSYAKEFLHYPDWFMITKINYDHLVNTISQPVLLLWGDQDPVSPVAVGQYLLQQLQHAQLEIISGGQHNLAYVYAQSVADLISVFLTQFKI